MAKWDKATAKASLVYNEYSKKVTTSNGTNSSRKLAKSNSRGSSSVTPKNNNGEIDRSTSSKRPIFQHLTRLQHGVLRYRNVTEPPTTSAALNNSNSSCEQKNDRRFVYVPAGYALPNDQSMREILRELHLFNLPPLLIVTAATDGAVEVTSDDDTQEEAPTGTMEETTSDFDHLSKEEERELLREKTREILRSTVELCEKTGAWILPHRPRRVNGAADILCGAASIRSEESKQAVILGLIGLDQQDHKDGFTQRITSHMVPVGSDMKANIADIPYDPNVYDNTPCPDMTHWLFFQRRQEMRTFRERLLASTPDVFLAFGSTTPYAKKCLFSTLIAKSPVALVTHTSIQIDRMSCLLRHADRELQKIQVGEIDPPPVGIATYAVVSDAPSTFATLPLAPLPDLETSDPELASFLPIWPAGHDDERIVLADPRRVNGKRFQQLLLRAVNAAFYIREARTVAIKEASQIRKSIQTASTAKKKTTELYQLSMVAATLLAVTASVFYAKIYGADPPPSLENRNVHQILLFLVTLGIPFVIAYLKKCYDSNSQQWSILQKEATNLESTIAFFRARPRTYGQSMSTCREPLDAFVSDVCAIRSHALLVGDSHDDKEKDNVVVEKTVEYDVEAPPPPSESSSLLPPPPTTSIPLPKARLEDLAIRGSTSKWKKTHNNNAAATTLDDCKYNQNPDNYPGVVDNSDRTQQCLDLESNQKKQEEGGGSDDPVIYEKECSTAAEDDTQMLWTIADYIDLRIHVAKQQTSQKLIILEQRHNTMELVIKAILGSTTLLALISKQWAIPIILGISAAFLSSQDFRKYKKRVQNGTTMISQLEDLLSWWDGLVLEDKILASHEDRIVQMAERIIAANVSFTY